MGVTRFATGVLLCNGMLATGTVAGATVTIKIADMVFDPAEITVAAGDIVTWKNGDYLDHTATAGSGDWDIVLPAGVRAIIDNSAKLPWARER